MNNDQLSNSLGNIGLVLVALTIPSMIACAYCTISDYKHMSNVCLFLTLFFPIVGVIILWAANKLSR